MRYNLQLIPKPVFAPSSKLIRPQLRFNFFSAWRRSLLWVLILTVCLSLGWVAPQPTFAKSCQDVQFIFARGSGEQLNDTSYNAWRTNITTFLKSSKLQYSFYELGSQKQSGHQYPAVSVSDDLEGFGNLLGAYIGRGQFFDFGYSVDEGRAELQAYFTRVSLTCPHTKFVLGGYSQGAMVLSQSLEQLDTSKIIYVSTFGDPKLYLPEGKGVIPPACLGKNLSDYRMHVPDCRAYEGILGSYRPYQPASYQDKLGTWCNEKDIMCSSGVSIKDHTSYTKIGLYADAAFKIHTKLRSTFPWAYQTVSAKLQPNASSDVVFLVDTTLSMKKYLSSYRPEFLALSKQIIDSGGRVGVVEFRDLDDPFEPQLICDLGCSQTQFEKTIRNFALQSVSDGGDRPESALSGLKYAMNHASWQTGANKSIVLVTDDRYVSPDRDGTTLAEVSQRSLEIDPVNVYTITLAEDKAAYQDLAQLTSGGNFVFNQADDWTKLATTLIHRPAARLTTSHYQGLVGNEFSFDASGSSDYNSSSLRYDWDLDGDGIFELQDGSSLVSHIYAQPSEHYVQVKVTNGQNLSSTMSAAVSVLTAMPTAPELTVDSVETVDTTSFKIKYTTDAEQILVAIDDVPIGHLDGATTEFILTDVNFTTNLRLIPYSAAAGRGPAVTLQLGTGQPPFIPRPSTTPDLPSQDSIEPPHTSPENPVPSSPTRPSAQYPSVTQPSAPQSLSSQNSHQPLPLAPNAGVAPLTSATYGSDASGRRTRTYKPSV